MDRNITDTEEFVTIIAPSTGEAMRQYKAQGLDRLGFAIAGRIGPHRFSLVSSGGSSADLFGGEGMIAATFSRGVTALRTPAPARPLPEDGRDHPALQPMPNPPPAGAATPYLKEKTQMLDKPKAPDRFPAPDYAPDRWRNIARTYGREDVRRLAGSLPIRHTLAEHGARRLWELLHTEAFLPTLGTFTGNQAVQQVKAGLKAIYLSGWQVAADANSSGNMYPDQSLYPVDSVPAVVKRINKALQRADQIQTMEQADELATTALDFFVPIIADAEAGFGGALNAFELMKAMIEAGAAAVHFEDQLASEKKCGHLGGKVLVPTSQFIRTLNAARLAADVMDVPTLIMARTDAEAARLITSDIDPYDAPFVTGERTAEGFYRLRGGIDAAIARGIAYAPYADLIWCETSKPDLGEARKFAEAIRKAHPEQMLAYNCSPSFNWAKHMDEAAMKRFQGELGAMGYKYQFITLAGFHNLSLSTFDLAHAYAQDGMAAYSKLQQAEFAAESRGFSAIRHQREVGTSYFDAVSLAVSEGNSATTAMAESTETAQFH